MPQQLLQPGQEQGGAGKGKVSSPDSQQVVEELWGSHLVPGLATTFCECGTVRFSERARIENGKPLFDVEDKD